MSLLNQQANKPLKHKRSSTMSVAAPQTAAHGPAEVREHQHGGTRRLNADFHNPADPADPASSTECFNLALACSVTNRLTTHGMKVG